MAGTHFSIAVEDAEVRARLAALLRSDTGALMPRLGEYLQASTQARFTTQTSPDGTPWAQLKTKYARRKRYNKDKILTLRGYLRSGIRYQVTGSNSVQVGTDTKYAAIHQLGGSINQTAKSRKVRYRSVAGRALFAGKRHTGTYQTNMPARPFLGISAADEQEVQSIVLGWVTGTTGR